MMPEFALLRAFNDMRDAVCSANSGALGTLLADDYRGVDARGCVDAGRLAPQCCIGGIPGVEKYEVADLEVHIFGDVGLVTWLGYMHGRCSDGTTQHRLRFCALFLRRDSKWQLFFTQCTELSNGATTLV